MSGAARIAGTVAAGIVACSTATFLWSCFGAHGAGVPGVRVDQWHHLYLGAIIAAWGAARRSPLLLAVAAAITADDAWQHLRQVTGDVSYVSPLHHLFATYLWPLAPVRRLVHALDGLLA